MSQKISKRGRLVKKAADRPTEKFRGVLTMLLAGSGDHIDVIEYGASIDLVNKALSGHLVKYSANYDVEYSNVMVRRTYEDEYPSTVVCREAEMVEYKPAIRDSAVLLSLRQSVVDIAERNNIKNGEGSSKLSNLNNAHTRASRMYRAATSGKRKTIDGKSLTARGVHVHDPC